MRIYEIILLFLTIPIHLYKPLMVKNNELTLILK